MEMGQWRIQDFCEGMRRGSGHQFFSEGMTPTFLRQIVSAHRRSQDFQRVDASRVDPGFLDFEGPERGAVGAKRRSAEGVRSGEGRRSPSPVRGHSPQKIFEI